MTKILSVASECAPLVKTGGLADVVGALPAALAALGDEMKTLIPGYPSVMSQAKAAKTVATLETLFGGHGKILSAKIEGLDLLILEAPHLF
ncbi:MAG: glycogen/starch synthase, partial [Paracoccaceae bacterium]